MTLTLDTRLRIGIQTVHRRSEPAREAWRPTIDELVQLTELVDRCGYDLLWVGDHISFPVAILDPLLQSAMRGGEPAAAARHRCLPPAARATRRRWRSRWRPWTT